MWSLNQRIKQQSHRRSRHFWHQSYFILWIRNHQTNTDMDSTMLVTGANSVSTTLFNMSLIWQFCSKENSHALVGGERKLLEFLLGDGGNIALPKIAKIISWSMSSRKHQTPIGSSMKRCFSALGCEFSNINDNFPPGWIHPWRHNCINI